MADRHINPDRHRASSFRDSRLQTINSPILCQVFDQRIFDLGSRRIEFDPPGLDNLPPFDHLGFQYDVFVAHIINPFFLTSAGTETPKKHFYRSLDELKPVLFTPLAKQVEDQVARLINNFGRDPQDPIEASNAVIFSSKQRIRTWVREIMLPGGGFPLDQPENTNHPIILALAGGVPSGVIQSIVEGELFRLRLTTAVKAVRIAPTPLITYLHPLNWKVRVSTTGGVTIDTSTTGELVWVDSNDRTNQSSEMSSMTDRSLERGFCQTRRGMLNAGRYHKS